MSTEYRPPRWGYPAPLGKGAAVESMTGIAAPLLAGFSLTLVGVIAQAPSSFRFPGLTLSVLIASTALFVACVQVGFRMRARLYSSADIDDWIPVSERDEIFSDDLARNQRDNYEKWLSLHRSARSFYNSAIVILAIGVGICLLPPITYGSIELTNFEFSTRISASVIAILAGIAELGWWYVDASKNRSLIKSAKTLALENEGRADNDPNES